MVIFEECSDAQCPFLDAPPLVRHKYVSILPRTPINPPAHHFVVGLFRLCTPYGVSFRPPTARVRPQCLHSSLIDRIHGIR